MLLAILVSRNVTILTVAQIIFLCGIYSPLSIIFLLQNSFPMYLFLQLHDTSLLSLLSSMHSNSVAISTYTITKRTSNRGRGLESEVTNKSKIHISRDGVIRKLKTKLQKASPNNVYNIDQSTQTPRMNHLLSNWDHSLT